MTKSYEILAIGIALVLVIAVVTKISLLSVWIRDMTIALMRLKVKSQVKDQGRESSRVNAVGLTSILNRGEFLPRDALLSAVYAVVVCLCVCVSVTLRYCIKTAKRRITQITPHDSPLMLVFWHQSSLRNSKGITPYGGDKCRWGGLKSVTFDENRAITRKRYKIDI